MSNFNTRIVHKLMRSLIISMERQAEGQSFKIQVTERYT